jgi:teichuronic acid biosynthesis glycosyltransferase TuaC
MKDKCDVAPAAEPSRRPRILSLCCLYPNPVAPAQGIFVQRRLQHLAELCDVQVLAPCAIIQYGSAPGKRLRTGSNAPPPRSGDTRLPVHHPRWLYPPLSGSLMGWWLFLQMIGPVTRLRREFPFEIIDAHFGHPEGLAACLLARWFGVPFTVTFRGNEPKHSRSRLERFWMSWTIRRADRILTVSERLREFAVHMGGAPGKVKVIPNGVDAGIFWRRDQERCRRKYEFPLDCPLIVSAGALVERKGHHRAIHAIQSLASRGINACLAIAGGPGPEGHYEAKLRSLVAELHLEQQVRFLGPIPADSMAEVMSAADVLCLSSTNEGWPNVVHEALACGAPVVATDVGAVSEMLGAGRYGIIVPVNDQDKLEAALEAALHRDWDRAAIAEWGQSRAWEHVAAEVLDEMRTIVSGRQ